jgi:uncharacterized protein YqfA (UPF0365 family)
MINPAYLPFILAGGVIIFLVIFFHYVPFFLWLSAKVSGVKISLIQLFLMRIRNVPPYVIVPAMIEAHKAGLSTITRDELEAHYMAGKGGTCAGIGIKSQHRPVFPDGHRNRPGRTRRVRSCTDVG